MADQNDAIPGGTRAGDGVDDAGLGLGRLKERQLAAVEIFVLHIDDDQGALRRVLSGDVSVRGVMGYV